MIISSDRDTSGDGLIVSKKITDGLGRPLEDRQYVDSTHYIAVVRSYDARGQLYQISAPYRTDTESALYTTMAYDELGRATSQTASDGSSATITVYDARGPLDPSTNHWAGPGGFGPPGGRGDWAASVHDYNFKTNGITIGSYFDSALSPATAKALIQSNNQLIRNAGGIQGIKMGLVFGAVNAFQWIAHSGK